MSRATRAALVLAVLLSIAPVSHIRAAQVCGTQVVPLLYVLTYDSPNDGADVMHSSFFVFTNGVSIYSFDDSTQFDRFLRFGGWSRLLAAPHVRQQLAAALGAARVAFATDCQYVTENVSRQLDVEVQWFGRGRRNHFRVTTRPLVPPCSAETQALIDQIVIFRSNSTLVESVGAPVAP